jgi:hypothetical protein
MTTNPRPRKPLSRKTIEQRGQITEHRKMTERVRTRRRNSKNKKDNRRIKRKKIRGPSKSRTEI